MNLLGFCAANQARSADGVFGGPLEAIAGGTRAVIAGGNTRRVIPRADLTTRFINGT